MIVEERRVNEVILYDSEILFEEVDECFDIRSLKSNGKICGSAVGRGTTWFIRLNSMDAALRHYRRGGLIGKIVKDSYFFLGINRTRSYREFYLLKSLSKIGVQVPRPIAARIVKKGLFYKADLISERISNAEDLVSILKDKLLSEEMYSKIGREIRKMHDAQVNHTDLNIHNILIDNQKKVWIIDFDKCNKKSGHHWKKKNIDRLKRSFEKELIKNNIKWSMADFSKIMVSYEEG